MASPRSMSGSRSTGDDRCRYIRWPWQPRADQVPGLLRRRQVRLEPALLFGGVAWLGRVRVLGPLERAKPSPGAPRHRNALSRYRPTSGQQTTHAPTTASNVAIVDAVTAA
jgi:hypothetical protein